MTFKRIGDVAARLIADPVKLQAAANEAPRKVAEPEGPAQYNREDNNASPKGRDKAIMKPSPAPKGRPVLMLVEGSRGRAIASANMGRPSPAVARPMLLVVEGGRHAVLANSP